MGLVAQQEKNIKQAIELLTKASHINPRALAVQINLGLALSEFGDHAAAIQCCKKAISENPRIAEAYFNYGNALRELRQPEEAIQYSYLAKP